MAYRVGLEQGFALLEGLLVAVLLGVGLLGLMGLEAATLRARGATREQLGALVLAMGAWEEAWLPGQDPGQDRPNRTTRTGPRLEGGTQPFYDLTVIRKPEEAGRVEVRVAWGGGAPGVAPARRTLILAGGPVF